VASKKGRLDLLDYYNARGKKRVKKKKNADKKINRWGMTEGGKTKSSVTFCPVETKKNYGKKPAKRHN